MRFAATTLTGGLTVAALTVLTQCDPFEAVGITSKEEPAAPSATPDASVDGSASPQADGAPPDTGSSSSSGGSVDGGGGVDAGKLCSSTDDCAGGVCCATALGPRCFPANSPVGPDDACKLRLDCDAESCGSEVCCFDVTERRATCRLTCVSNVDRGRLCSAAAPCGSGAATCRKVKCGGSSAFEVCAVPGFGGAACTVP